MIPLAGYILRFKHSYTLLGTNLPAVCKVA